MAYAGLIMAAVAAVGSIAQAQSASKAAKYNESVARGNAIVARNAAQEEARRSRRLSMKRQGTLRASGASLDLLEDSAMQEELQALTIEHQGEVEAAGYGASANVNKARASNESTSGYFGAASTLLNGASSYANAS